MQTATRRYAKRQTSWIRNQLLPEICRAQARGEDVWLYLLDATELQHWDERVRVPARDILRSFLQHESMCDPASLSSAAAEHLQHVVQRTEGRIQRNKLVPCEICTHDEAQPFLFRENERGKHEQSRTHRYALKRRTKDAYIAACRASSKAAQAADQADGRSTDDSAASVYRTKNETNRAATGHTSVNDSSSSP